MSARSEPCAHPDFRADVRVYRSEDTKRFTTDIEVRCTVCGIRFRWLGLPMGSNPTQPMVSVDEFTLRAPIEPDPRLTPPMAEVWQ